MNQDNLHIVLFVYGTLKRGQWNHARFCRNAVDIRPATIVGRLYQLPAGFPAVVIPDESILAHGTADPVADARTEAEFVARGVTMPEVEGDWDTVHGELITFPDPARDMPPIDRLEGFQTDGRGSESPWNPEDALTPFPSAAAYMDLLAERIAIQTTLSPTAVSSMYFMFRVRTATRTAPTIGVRTNTNRVFTFFLL